MAVYVRAKRVTDPLDEKARARLRGEMTGYASSDSEHEASTCLSGLVQAFLESGASAAESREGSDREGDSDDEGAADRATAAATRMRELLDLPAEMDQFRIRLAAEVTMAMEEEEEGMKATGSAFRRAVMTRLRAAGYEAGICKARWEAAGGITAGSYEYIDVVSPGKEKRRYIVDADFMAAMEVARATEEYARVAPAVPRVVVAMDVAIGKAVRLTAMRGKRKIDEILDFSFLYYYINIFYFRV